MVQVLGNGALGIDLNARTIAIAVRFDYLASLYYTRALSYALP